MHCGAAFVKWNDAVYLKHHSTIYVHCDHANAWVCIINVYVLNYVYSSLYDASSRWDCSVLLVGWIITVRDEYRPFHSIQPWFTNSFRVICIPWSIIPFRLLHTIHKYVVYAQQLKHFMCVLWYSVYRICIAKSIKSRTVRQFFKIG